MTAIDYVLKVKGPSSIQVYNWSRGTPKLPDENSPGRHPEPYTSSLRHSKLIHRPSSNSELVSGFKQQRSLRCPPVEDPQCDCPPLARGAVPTSESVTNRLVIFQLRIPALPS